MLKLVALKINKKYIFMQIPYIMDLLVYFYFIYREFKYTFWKFLCETHNTMGFLVIYNVSQAGYADMN